MIIIGLIGKEWKKNRRTQCEQGLSVRKYLDLCKIHGFSAEPYGSARTADLRPKARHIYATVLSIRDMFSFCRQQFAEQ